jgi:PIN domain nuclease of toxin-antitoxin system
VDSGQVRVLTDTHSLVWALSDPGSLSVKAHSVLIESEVIASVANLWELSLKAQRKDALLADPIAWWNKYVAMCGIQALPIRASHVVALAALRDIHKDPFDRILVAQSIVEKMPLVTKDAHLAEYGIQVIW